MKKLIFLILYAIFFSLTFTSCLWCQLDDEADFLPNTDFYIVPEKDSYSLDEELLLTFSSIPNFSTFDKYTFEICSKEYDTDKRNIYRLIPFFSWIPTLILTPKVGICQNTLWLGTQINNIIDLGITATVANTKAVLTEDAFVNYTLNIKPSAGVSVTVPVVDKRWEKTYSWTGVKIGPKRIKTWKIM